MVKSLPSLPGIHENPEEQSGEKHPLPPSKKQRKRDPTALLSSPKGGDKRGAFNLQALRKATTERAESPTLPLKRAWGTKKKSPSTWSQKSKGTKERQTAPAFQGKKKHYKLPYSTDEAVRKNSPHPAREVREGGDKKGKKPLLIHPEAASENTACILHIYRQTAEKDRISKKSQAKKLSESDKKTNRIAEERQKEKKQTA